jgi:hypothetical protein
MDPDLMRARVAELVSDEFAALARGEAEPFVWGKRDCVLWPANILVAAGLDDPIPEIRGAYRSMLGAYRLMGEGGLLKGLERKARRHKWCELKAGETLLQAGARERNFDDARPGDIGVIEQAIPMPRRIGGKHGPEGVFVARVMFCVLRGPQGDWHGPIDNGLSCYPDRQVVRAWNVLRD